MNPRERAFVRAFVGAAAGNATKAAILAGYSRKSARRTATRLSSKDHIRKALEHREKQRAAQDIGDADARDRVLWSIASDEHAAARDRIRAIVELNKCSGRHSVTLHHKGRTLEEILAESRQPRAESTTQ